VSWDWTVAQWWAPPEVALQVASTVPERLSALVLLCAAAEGVEVDLARITCKATIVSGNRDLPWAGHLPNLERPTETTQLIRRSIRHRASASAYARRRCQF